jgi:hypothetical protein
MWLCCLCACVAVALCVAPVAAQAPAKPGPEQEALKKFEGHWDATVSVGGGESKGTAEYKIGLGGLWLLLHFKGDFAGAPFEGRGATGYDPNKKKYVSSWIDSMSSQMLLLEGNFDKDGHTYTEVGEGMGEGGKLQKMKSVYEFKGDDKFVFTMYTVADGKDQQMMQITYTRKK